MRATLPLLAVTDFPAVKRSSLETCRLTWDIAVISPACNAMWINAAGDL